MLLKLRLSTWFNVFIFTITLAYCYLIPSTEALMKIDAILVIFLSFFLLIRSRKNLALFILSYFIFYVNYSIVFGEYVIGSPMVPPMTEVRTDTFYGLGIRGLLLFMIIFSLFLRTRNTTRSDGCVNFELVVENKNVPFLISIVLLSFSLIFGLKRGPIGVYEVRITPLFEYSKLLFLFAYYYGGASRFKRWILIAFALAFILNDAMYGGRVTSVQILIVLALTIFIKNLTPFRTVILSIPGIIFSAFVGAFRSSFSFQGLFFGDILKKMVSGHFVFDTATYAYYSSITHIAATFKSSISERLSNMFANFTSYFVGQSFVGPVDVTVFVKERYFFNMGGGIIFSHFYFWLGWVGIALFTFFIVFIINRILEYRSTLAGIVFYSVIINVPRWYVYGPNQFFRGSIVIPIFLFMIFKIIELVTSPQKHLKYIKN